MIDRGFLKDDADDTEDDKKRLSSLQVQLDKLEREKKFKENEIEQLKASSTEDKDRLEELEKELDAAVALIETTEKQKEEEIAALKEKGENIESALEEAFKKLAEIDKEQKADIYRLNVLFYGFGFIALGLAVALTLFWYNAFDSLTELLKGNPEEGFAFSRLWFYTTPSLIMVAFIWGSIMQVNRAQRQLVVLKRQTRKYKIAKLALEGHYKVENPLNKTPEKAQEVFSRIIDMALNEKIDIDAEEDELKEISKKDKTPYEESAGKLLSTANQLIETVIKLKK